MKYSAHYNSPVGWLLLEADESAITKVHFMEVEGATTASLSPVLKQGIAELEEYFSGNREVFSVPLKPIGTDFQQKVWKQLLTIPFAKTFSYSQVAAQLGNQKSIRA
ncbi:MAG: MGMT family protein, partial [Chitinophagales bacterium]